MTLIREAAPADLTALAQLCGALGYPAEAAAIAVRLAGIAGSDTDLLLVAENEQVVVGWVQVHLSWVLEVGFRAEIAGLVVSPDSRRTGVGRLLIAAAERWARDQGASSVTVRSNNQRVESHKFYPAIGYERKKTQEVYWKALGGPHPPDAGPPDPTYFRKGH
jgi:ribosomal protein S18 acetylase RimI-like enzyme